MQRYNYKQLKFLHTKNLNEDNIADGQEKTSRQVEKTAVPGDRIAQCSLKYVTKGRLCTGPATQPHNRVAAKIQTM